MTPATTNDEALELADENLDRADALAFRQHVRTVNGREPGQHILD